MKVCNVGIHVTVKDVSHLTELPIKMTSWQHPWHSLHYWKLRHPHHPRISRTALVAGVKKGGKGVRYSSRVGCVTVGLFFGFAVAVPILFGRP